jgi:hypothetical protein
LARFISGSHEAVTIIKEAASCAALANLNIESYKARKNKFEIASEVLCCAELGLQQKERTPDPQVPLTVEEEESELRGKHR